MNGPIAHLLRPAGVAVVGASRDPDKHGSRVVANLRRLGFDAPVWAVNRRGEGIRGADGVVPTVAELPGNIDIVVCAVPGAGVLEAVRDAGQLGARAAVIFSAGFAEAGKDGLAAQRRLTEAAAAGGVRLLGPNSGGVICPANRVALSFLTCLDRPAEEIRSGPVALVTQSGGTGSYVHNLAAARGAGLAASISTGNEADLDVAEAIAALAGWEAVRAIAVVLETVRRGAEFVDALASAREHGKPVVVCRLGRSRLSSSLLQGHTGALAVADRVLSGVLDSEGVVSARTPEEMLDVAEMMATAAVPRGGRIGIVAHSGGTAILLADLAAADGLELPPPSPALGTAIEPYLQGGIKANPLDLGAIIGGPGRFAEVVRRFRDSGEYDAVLAVSTPHPPAHTAERADALADVSANGSPVPVLNLWMAGDLGTSGMQTLRAAGAPVTEEPRAAVRAIAGLCRLAAVTGEDSRAPAGAEPPMPSPREQTGPGRVLSEGAARELLASWQIASCEGQTAHDPAEAEAVASRLGFPVVAKIDAPGLPHKSALGAVRLDLRSAAEVRASFEAITGAVALRAPHVHQDGVLITRFEPGLELLAGCVTDRVFGPVAVLGLGGTATELLDMAVASPVRPGCRTGRRLLGRLSAALPRSLEGLARAARAEPDWNGLADVVDRLARAFVAGQPRLMEVEINPLIWTGGQWKAADAMVCVSEPETAGGAP